MNEMMNGIQDPICQLPVEVARRIFGLCFAPVPVVDGPSDSDIRYDSWTYRQDVKFQLKLGAVSRKWRQIIWSNPFFWRCVFVKLSDETPVTISILVKEWLNRSAQLPLVISLRHRRMLKTASDHDIEYVDAAGQAMLDTICSVADRWSLVSLELPSSYIHNLRIRTLQPHFTLLHVETTDINPNTSLDFGNASGPKRLQIHHISLENLHIQCSAITHFYQGGLSTDDYLQVLRRTPHLLWANIHNAEGVKLPLSSVTNSTIQHLRVDRAAAAFWQSLTLPALEVLNIYGDLQCIESSSDFVRRSQCPLKSVSFSGSSDEGDILSFLKMVPSTETLELAWCESKVEKALYELLAETEISIGARAFLPNLSTLSIIPSEHSPWASLAKIASPKSSLPASVLRRPLYKIAIASPGPMYFPQSNEGASSEIDAGSLRKILSLIDSGIEVKLRDCFKQDIVDAWIEHYKTRGGDYEWLKSYRGDNHSAERPQSSLYSYFEVAGKVHP